MRLNKMEPWVLGGAVVLPTLVTFVYFVLLKTQSATIQQVAYSTGKLIQFALPVVWVGWFCRQGLGGLLPWKRENLEANLKATAGALANDRSLNNGPSLVGISIGFGVFVAVSVFVGFYFVLSPLGMADLLVTQVKEKVARMSLDSPGKFLILGMFYALVHSFLEEYYWRWFVFGRLLSHVKPAVAIAISSVGFMAHHVILMATFLGWNSPMAYLISATVAVGGAVWAWIYYRSGRLLGPWFSHMIVDAAIFALGYVLVFGRSAA
jgi:membrane protease YdiL (CAAX protease family)